MGILGRVKNVGFMRAALKAAFRVLRSLSCIWKRGGG